MPRTQAQKTDVEDKELWKSELGQYITSQADETISIEEVRKTLTSISIPLAQIVQAEREAHGR